VLNHSPSLDRVFLALADPTRRAIVERLGERPASVSELARPLPMSLSAVVQHLAVLEECGLVRSRKVGRVRTCELDPDTLAVARRWLDERKSAWERRFDRLGEHLASTPETEE
jgi:DNA-binding transcriptional ArsR family regulator